MKYTMSMAANEEHLKELVMSDAKMTNMEKLCMVFNIDKKKIEGAVPFPLLCDSRRFGRKQKANIPCFLFY